MVASVSVAIIHRLYTTRKRCLEAVDFFKKRDNLLRLGDFNISSCFQMDADVEQVTQIFKSANLK